jgi:hypothetical protein
MGTGALVVENLGGPATDARDGGDLLDHRLGWTKALLDLPAQRPCPGDIGGVNPRF